MSRLYLPVFHNVKKLVKTHHFPLEIFIDQMLPSGHRLRNYGKSPCYSWLNPLPMAIFNSFLYVYQRRIPAFFEASSSSTTSVPCCGCWAVPWRRTTCAPWCAAWIPWATSAWDRREHQWPLDVFLGIEKWWFTDYMWIIYIYIYIHQI